MAKIYGISGILLRLARAAFQNMIPDIKHHSVLHSVKKEEYEEVGRVLGVAQGEIRRVFRELVR